MSLILVGGSHLPLLRVNRALVRKIRSILGESRLICEAPGRILSDFLPAFVSSVNYCLSDERIDREKKGFIGLTDHNNAGLLLRIWQVERRTKKEQNIK